MIVFWWLIFAVITWFFPRRLKLLAFVINLLLPDPVPYVDEVIILVGYLRDLELERRRRQTKN